ncbi:MAG: gliding motility protein GldL [Bacteroidota bacterium]|jgi:gliding motility-associated protein GldL|nr:gliding motility protein GldL [Chitinophagia bacterium]
MSEKSKKIEKRVNTIVSLGAAVVIFGAWAKILHKSFADYMLTIGLLTEAAIFLLYAFIPPSNEMAEVAEVLKKNSDSTPSNDELKKLIEKEINPDSLKKLNESFAKLNSTIQGIAAVGDMASASANFTNKTNEAANALSTLKDAYSNTAQSLQQFNAAADSSKIFHEQMATLNKNLGALNKIYESELGDMTDHLKMMNTFYENLAKASQSMVDGVGDAKKTQEQISLLAKNLSSLNSIYGNMLTAMQPRG